MRTFVAFSVEIPTGSLAGDPWTSVRKVQQAMEELTEELRDLGARMTYGMRTEFGEKVGDDE